MASFQLILAVVCCCLPGVVLATNECPTNSAFLWHQKKTFQVTDEFWNQFELDLRNQHCEVYRNTTYMPEPCYDHRYDWAFISVVYYLRDVCPAYHDGSASYLSELVYLYCDYHRNHLAVTHAYDCATGCHLADHLNQVCNDESLTAPCLLYPCENGGTCGTNGQCSCLPGYSGNQCERYNPCEGDPCGNGGTCQDPTKSFTCSCKPGFTGPRCNARSTGCSSYPCQNGGNCQDQGEDAFKCHCARGFEGRQCQYTSCSDNWRLNVVDNVERCFKYFDHKRNQGEAQKFCEQQKGVGTLAWIRNAEENAFVFELIKATAHGKSARPWIGLVDTIISHSNHQRDWKWDGRLPLGTTYGYINWNDSTGRDRQPSNPIEDCVVMNHNYYSHHYRKQLADGAWHDVSCGNHHTFVCQRPNKH